MDVYKELKFLWGGGSGGQDRCEQKSEVFVKIQEGGQGEGVFGEWGGHRVDVNKELKFL